jgi:hypothetical protein
MTREDYSIHIISCKPEKFPAIQNSLLPEQINYFDGTGYESFSRLVNQCVVSANTEIVIIISDRVMPTAEHVQKALDLIDQGYGFVALYRFAFFAFRKELMRRIGMMDERYVGGGYEDNDYYLRLIEAGISFYITEEVPYKSGPTTWPYTVTRSWHAAKWGAGINMGVIHRSISEETYAYDLGPSMPTNFLPFDKSYTTCQLPLRYMQFPIHQEPIENYKGAIKLEYTGSQIINQLPTIKEKTYLELGVRNNINFNHIQAQEKFSVDLNGQAMFTGTTDQYFDQLEDHKKFDIIFIDACHDYEFVVRDFNNSVEHCTQWILLHDCVPPNLKFTSRTLCSDSFRVLYYLLKETDFEVYVMDDNYGLTLVKMPASRINPPGVYSEISYEEFARYIETVKLYSSQEIIDILKEQDV